MLSTESTGPAPARRIPRPRVVLVCVALLVAAATIAIAASGTVNTTGPAARPADTEYATPGPYAAGTARYTMPDGDRVQVWYPAGISSTRGRTPYAYDIASWLPASLATGSLAAGLADKVPTDSYQNIPIATDTTLAGGGSGGFPVVLFSHAYGSYPEESSFLTDHLATWGFVVAAPDHRSQDIGAVLQGTAVPRQASGLDSTAEPGNGADVDDLTTTLTFLRSLDNDPRSMLHHALDLARVGVIGDSSGGGTAITMAGNPAVKTYVALAPTPGIPPTTSTPGLVMYGNEDSVAIPATVQTIYAGLPAPKRVIVIDGAGNNVFDDTCEITGDGTSLVDLLDGQAGTGEVGKRGAGAGRAQLATLDADGCRSPDLDPVTARPLIDQAVTAQLRYGLGIDATAVGLGAGLDHAYAGVSSHYYQRVPARS